MVAILYQRRYNKLHHSIYGLSYDLFVLDLLGNCLSVYCTLNYRLSPLLRSQFAKRFPLFYPLDKNQVPISLLLLLKDLLIMAASALVIRQLVLYRATKHIYQGLSKICLIVLIISAIFAVFTYTCSCYDLPMSDSGRFGVFYLEHINYLWVIGNVLRAFRFLPQLTLNWMGSSTRGLSSKYVLITSLGNSIMLLGLAILPQQIEFYRSPFNLTPVFVKAIETISLIGILYQAQYLYLGTKPYLPKGK